MYFPPGSKRQDFLEDADSGSGCWLSHGEALTSPGRSEARVEVSGLGGYKLDTVRSPRRGFGF